MVKPLELLRMAVMSLLILQESSATHPFYQAFSPLREAFGDGVFDLKPSPDSGALYTSQSSEATSPLGALFREEYDKADLRHNSATLNSAGIQLETFSSIRPQQETLSRTAARQEDLSRIGAQQETLSSIEGQQETTSRIGDQQETSSRIGGQQETTSRIRAQQETSISTRDHQQASGSLNLGKSAFNLDTFTFNRNNTRRRDDIFSALADVEVDLPEESETAEDEHLRVNTISGNRIPPKSQEGDDHRTANDFTKKILSVVKNVENVLSTMSFMKNLYHTKKAGMSLLSSSSSSSLSTPTETSSILDVLLDVPLLESLRTVGLTARTERDFLDHMASVLVGAESRSSTLTLDPVTVIALLTLAAYLIRAVYEIITVTGRSLDGDLESPAFSDLPEAITKIHNWISTTNVDVVGEGNVTKDVKDNLDVPGDLAAVLKLHRQGNHSCVKEFLCQSLQYRPLKMLKLSDMMIGWISYFYGDPTVSHLIDSALEDSNTCSGSTHHTCSPGTLIEISQLRSIFSSLTEKLVGLVDTYQNSL
ncbi:uncharacterized protein LOC135197693 [Macrobrachium nipponense]|uniref:uncharacterized protein LOC135197693 n=1 Tax=Macrobrachium nipponense TaxID=159736 RepID=UPI0030C8A0CD